MSDIKVNKVDKVVNIIRDAGGKIVGRTRLQKIAYLLSATGLDNNFQFSYKHYGPFSEELASSAKIGALFGDLDEQQDRTAWGGMYSIYSVDNPHDTEEANSRHSLASIAVAADSIELELAATAVFLFHEGYQDPWEQTKQRKPEKSTQARLSNAKILLKKLSDLEVPTPIPDVLIH